MNRAGLLVLGAIAAALGTFPGAEPASGTTVLDPSFIRLTPDRARTFHFPYDGVGRREVVVENTGPVARRITLAAEVPASPRARIKLHPESPHLLLQPGQKETVIVLLDWRELGSDRWKAGQRRTVMLDLNVHPEYFEEGPTLATTRLVTPVQVRARCGFGTGELRPPPNAAVRGVVTGPTGRRVPFARVAVSVRGFQCGIGYRGRADGSGRYRLPLFAWRDSFLGRRLQYSLAAQPAGESNLPVAHRAVVPRPGARLRMNVRIPPLPRVQYRVVKSFATKMPVFYADASKDGSIFATAPYHAEAPHITEAYRRANSAVHLFSRAGKLLWRFPIGTETPTVDVSDDGSLVVFDRRRADGMHSVVVVNRAGAVVWQPLVRDQGSRAVIEQFSHDKRYLAIGTLDGEILVYDVPRRRLLWQTRYNGMARQTRFDLDDSGLFVSNGDGGVRAFSARDGRLLWTQRIHGWSYVLRVTRRFVLVMGKAGYEAAVFRKTDGRALFRAPTDCVGNNFQATPDESAFMFVAIAGCSPQHILYNRRGLPIWEQGQGGHYGILSPDARYVFSYGYSLTDDSYDQVLRVTTRAGTKIYERRFARRSVDFQAPSGYIAASRDNRRLIIGSAIDGKVYFLRGAIR